MPLPPHLQTEVDAIDTALSQLTQRIATAQQMIPAYPTPEHLTTLQTICADALVLHTRSVNLVIALHHWAQAGRPSEPI